MTHPLKALPPLRVLDVRVLAGWLTPNYPQNDPTPLDVLLDELGSRSRIPPTLRDTARMIDVQTNSCSRQHESYTEP